MDTNNEMVTAFVKAQKEMKGAVKSSNNPFFKSKYADLGSVWEACHQALTDNGFAIAQHGTYHDGQFFLRTTLLHTSGGLITGDYLIKPTKEDPQAYGSAWTYSRRYSLAAMVGVMSEDDDGNAATHNSPAPAKVAVASAVLREVFKPKPNPVTAEQSEPDPIQHGDPDLKSVRAVISGASAPKEFRGSLSYGWVTGDKVWLNANEKQPDIVKIMNEAKGNKMPVIVTYKTVGKGNYIRTVSWVPTVNDSKPDPEISEKEPEFIEVGF